MIFVYLRQTCSELQISTPPDLPSNVRLFCPFFVPTQLGVYEVWGTLAGAMAFYQTAGWFLLFPLSPTLGC